MRTQSVQPSTLTATLATKAPQSHVYSFAGDFSGRKTDFLMAPRNLKMPSRQDAVKMAARNKVTLMERGARFLSCFAREGMSFKQSVGMARMLTTNHKLEENVLKMNRKVNAEHRKMEELQGLINNVRAKSILALPNLREADARTNGLPKAVGTLMKSLRSCKALTRPLKSYQSLLLQMQKLQAKHEKLHFKHQAMLMAMEHIKQAR